MPIVSGEAEVTTYVLTRTLQDQSDLCPPENCYTRIFPYQKANLPEYSYIYFEDWQPGKYTALIHSEVFKPHWSACLFLWDVKNDHVSTLVPGGIHARFSSDGKYLLFTTVGQYPEYSSVAKEAIVIDPISSVDNVYLQLMIFRDQKMLMSLPAMSVDDFNNKFFPEDFKTAFFSPDGYYLAFQSLGLVVTDEKGWPIGIDPKDASQTYLNIVDLEAKKLLYSLPNPNEWLDLVWAPTSNKLVYPDNSDNWILVDLSKMKALPITGNKSIEFNEAPTWSFDGRYLSFTAGLPTLINDFRKTMMFIFDIKGSY